MTVSPENIARTPILTDSLSEVLAAVRFIGGHVEAHTSEGNSSPAFRSGERSLLIVRSGTLLMRCGDVGPQETELHAGDIVLLAYGSDFSVSYPARPPESGTLRAGRDKQAKHCAWLRGTFHLDERLSGRLLSSLPKVMILRHVTHGAMDWLETSSRFALDEIEAREPGGKVMISRIIELLLIRVLRLWALDPAARASWLVGATDPAIGRALGIMHGAPERKWTVSELAWNAGLSRSVFANRFVALVGEPPLRYLIGLRLDKAAELLQRTRLTISEVSEATGYESEAAFSRAFKLRFGSSPSRWRRQ